MNAGWQHNGYSSRDLCVDIRVEIDGYQTLDYIYKGMYICINDIIKTCGVYTSISGEMPAYRLYLNPYMSNEC